MLKKPRLLLLDEPGVGVDPISRRDLWKMVEDLTKEGIGVVWSTAYLDEAEACDGVLLLNQGKLLFSGEPDGHDRRVSRAGCSGSTGVAGRNRQVLAKLLDEEGIIDGVIQGEAIRLVTGEGCRTRDLLSAGDDANAPLPPPRFEDAFVDMLGGGPGGRSKLAEAQQPLAAKDDRPVIEAKGLTKRFGDFTAADDITFDIRRGEIFGLLGPNGAGKSTTFKMLCGLSEADRSGEGRVAGFDLRRDAAAARNQLGYMAQKFSLYGDLSIAQNLDFFAGVYGLSGQRKRERIAADGRRSSIFGRHACHVVQGPAARAEATAGARLRRHARAAGAVPRRAHLRRRSDHAARILDAYQCARRKGRDGARHHPFHGRGGILRPDFADLSRPLDRARLAG